jgi:hypothetical protein
MSYYSIIPPCKGRRNWKRRYEIRHSRERALERFEILLTNDIRKQIVRAIQKKRAEFVEKQTNRVSVWKVQLKDLPLMIVVYDRQRQEIITVMKENEKYTQEDVDGH